MIWRTGTIVIFDDAPLRGAIANPTRSFVLGDPTKGGVGVGCVVDLIDHVTISAGSSGRARIGLVESEVAASLLAPVDIWWGGTIGRVDSFDSDDFWTAPEPREAP